MNIYFGELGGNLSSVSFYIDGKVCIPYNSQLLFHIWIHHLIAKWWYNSEDIHAFFMFHEESNHHPFSVFVTLYRMPISISSLISLKTQGSVTVDHWMSFLSLEWRHNGLDTVSNHQPQDCLLNRLFRRRSKKTWKFRFTGLCEGNSSGTGEFPAQMASNTKNVSIWWRHHGRISK